MGVVTLERERESLKEDKMSCLFVLFLRLEYSFLPFPQKGFHGKEKGIDFSHCDDECKNMSDIMIIWNWIIYSFILTIGIINDVLSQHH